MSTAGFSVMDTAYPPGTIYGTPVGLIEGSYTAVLVSGVALGPADATLVQTGIVPPGTESLRFKAQFAPFNTSGSFDVTLDGQTLSLVPVGSGANYTVYAADIHTLAAQTAELSFTVHGHAGQVVADYLFLDSVQFSNQRVREPGVFALSALGALFLAAKRLRQQ
jgi:hypothetical protein